MRQSSKAAFFCVLLALPVATLINVAQTHHASLVLSHYFRGRVGNCSLKESFDAEALSRLQYANVDSLFASSRILRHDEHYSLWSTPAGEFWMATASGNALMYDLAEQKRNIYGSRIRPGDVVLDAGANVGVFTRKALRAGASKVIAIEPAPENLECLRRNFVKEIADGRVVLYPKGIWDKDDVLRLSVDPTDSARDTFVRHIESANFIEAPLTTIDKLVAELKLSRVDFIKMDIEGAERKAITGGKDTIARFHPRMALCIYHIVGDEVMIPKMVSDISTAYTVSRACLCGRDAIQPEVAFFN